MQVRRWVAAVVLVLPMLLAGCGGEDDPGVAVSASPSGTSSGTASAGPSESPSAEPSDGLTMPAAAKKKTQAGAEAFIEYWLDAVFLANSTGDTSALETVSLPGCESCRSTKTWVEGFYEEGGHITAARWKIRYMSKLRRMAQPQLYNLIVRARIPKEVLHHGSGEAQVKPASQVTLDFNLKWTGKQWAIAQWAIPSSA